MPTIILNGNSYCYKLFCRISKSDLPTLSVWGNYRLQKGIITTIEEKKLNFSKNYKVVSSKHKISAIDEEVTIEIEKYEG